MKSGFFDRSDGGPIEIRTGSVQAPFIWFHYTCILGTRTAEPRVGLGYPNPRELIVQKPEPART
jgi:hypothetical protein